MIQRRIVDYKIVEVIVFGLDYWSDKLEEAMRKAIKEGWEPYGAPIFAGDYILHPVVKYAEDEIND